MAICVNLLAIIVLIVSLALACNFFGDVRDIFQRYFGSKAEVDVVIGILSARNHFEQRQALRDTWVGQIKDNPKLSRKILVKFLVGQKACEVPVEYREDPYSCKELNISYNEKGPQKSLVAFQATKCTVEKPRTGGSIGFDFKVNHAVIVDKLGVYDDGRNGTNRPVKVILYDTWRREPIAISYFSKEQPGTVEDGFRYRPVEPYILPKNFEGTIVVEGLDHEETRESCMIASASGNGLITVKQFNRYGALPGVFPLDTERLVSNTPHHSSGNFIYHIHDPEALSMWRHNRPKEEAEHTKKTAEETRKLREELSLYNDLLLLDVIDTYRNIPKKLLQFYKRVDSTLNFQFVIKTDDDCFLSIHNIMQGIKAKKLQKTKRTWWGHFRTSWAVDHDGKWAELEYPCSGYPSFACGAGSLLTADVVRWISHNARYLHSYQGEDISMGIWLSSILPTYDHDTRWICDETCQTDMYVSAEHTPEELRTMWTNLDLCDNPCGCSDASEEL